MVFITNQEGLITNLRWWNQMWTENNCIFLSSDRSEARFTLAKIRKNAKTKGAIEDLFDVLNTEVALSADRGTKTHIDISTWEWDQG